MTAAESFQAGRLAEAIEAQTREVKANPADPNRRLFLFELLSFAGDLDRGRRQIDAINYGDLEQDAAVQDYQALLQAEDARRRFFHADGLPEVVGEALEHVQLRLQAIQELRQGRLAEGAALLERAAEAIPDVTGQLNGQPFRSFFDDDIRFGTVLEAFSRGKYYWVPLENVATVVNNAPKYPRDLLWAPARLLLRDGSSADVFLPVLYPDSHLEADDAIKFGRTTEWRDITEDEVRGVGQRVFVAEDREIGVLEMRQLDLA